MTTTPARTDGIAPPDGAVPPDWRTTSEPVSLAPGHHVLVTDAGWALACPDGSYVALRRGGAQRASLVSVLHGHLAPARALATSADSSTLSEVLDLFWRQGLLVTTPGDAPRAVVAVLGDDRVARSVGVLLAAEGLEVHTRAAPEAAPPEGLLPAVDVVVACGGWLPDAAWLAWDRACAGVAALHLCHLETSGWFLGPFAAREDRPRYRDLRARRLAAAPFPDLLRASWSALRASSAPVPPRLDAAGTAVVAGLLAGDVIAFAAGRPVPGRGHQVHVDPGAGQVRRHPVLTVPEHLDAL